MGNSTQKSTTLIQNIGRELSHVDHLEFLLSKLSAE